MQPAISPPRPPVIRPIAILLVATLAAGVVQLCSARARSRATIARDQERSLFSAFDALHHATCEASRDYQTFVPMKLMHDAWGQPYLFECNRRGFTVVSAGEDGRYGTDDDLRSDR